MKPQIQHPIPQSSLDSPAQPDIEVLKLLLQLDGIDDYSQFEQRVFSLQQRNYEQLLTLAAKNNLLPEANIEAQQALHEKDIKKQTIKKLYAALCDKQANFTASTKGTADGITQTNYQLNSTKAQAGQDFDVEKNFDNSISQQKQLEIHALAKDKKFSQIKTLLLQAIYLKPQDTNNSVGGLQLRNEMSPQGQSGQADKIPIAQFLPTRFHTLAKQISIHSLADFLAYCSTFAARQMLAFFFKLPQNSLLLAAYRAQLLDLPLASKQTRTPHIKDILLFSQLGIHTNAQLASFGKYLHDRPQRFDMTAKVLQNLQKACKDLKGRQFISSPDLKQWTAAAQSRKNDLLDLEAKLPPQEADIEAAAAEKILHWFLQSQPQDQKTFGKTVLTNLAARMKREQQAVSADFQALLEEANISEQRLQERQQELQAREALTQQRLLDSQRRADNEAEHSHSEKTAAYNYDELLFFQLSPKLIAGHTQTTGRICFFVDPVPDFRHVTQFDGDAPPESIKAQYVCMDLQSGAIAPFGAGI